MTDNYCTTCGITGSVKGVLPRCERPDCHNPLQSPVAPPLPSYKLRGLAEHMQGLLDKWNGAAYEFRASYGSDESKRAAEQARADFAFYARDHVMPVIQALLSQEPDSGAKPVAWLLKDADGTGPLRTIFTRIEPLPEEAGTWVPLFASPVTDADEK